MANSFKFLSADEICESLSEKIETLEYKPGDRVSENELCQVYNVSRHVIRNVIARLSDQGLMEVYPQRGTFVSLIDLRYIDSLLYVRESVEQETASRLIQMGAPEAILLPLRKKAEEQQNLVNSGLELQRFHAMDADFHKSLLSAVGKGNVWEFINGNYIHVRRWLKLVVQEQKRMEEIVGEHFQILDRIEARDHSGVYQVIHRHLDTVERFEDAYRDLNPEYFIPLDS